jgi:hypothetical protein
MATAIKHPVSPAADVRTQADAESFLASIRDSVRQLDPSRYSEIFEDFEAAVTSKNINYLADTIANWALGGSGYDHMPIRVNHTLDRTTVDKGDPSVTQSWTEFLKIQQPDDER